MDGRLIIPWFGKQACGARGVEAKEGEVRQWRGPPWFSSSLGGWSLGQWQLAASELRSAAGRTLRRDDGIYMSLSKMPLLIIRPTRLKELFWVKYGFCGYLAAPAVNGKGLYWRDRETDMSMCLQSVLLAAINLWKKKRECKQQRVNLRDVITISLL
jgi:hypothetical protein